MRLLDSLRQAYRRYLENCQEHNINTYHKLGGLQALSATTRHMRHDKLVETNILRAQNQHHGHIHGP